MAFALFTRLPWRKWLCCHRSSQNVASFFQTDHHSFFS